MRQLRNSEIQSFRTCRMQWHWGYRQRLESTAPRAALWFGTMVHAALEGWYIPGYKRGVHPARTFERLMQRHLAQGLPDPITSNGRTYGELGIAMLEGYVDTYGTEDYLRVVQPECNFQTRVRGPMVDGKRHPFLAVGQIDAVVYDKRKDAIGFMEHKTGATLEPFGAPEVLDEQSSYYWAFGTDWLRNQGILKSGEEPEFVMFNRLRKAFPSDKPTNAEGKTLNKDGSISKNQPPALFGRSFVYRSPTERIKVRSRTIQTYREMLLTERGFLRPYKNPNRHCGFCEFRDMCEVHEIGTDWRAFRNAMYTKWDPYEEYGEQ